ncbi:MAG: hypothetical protein L0G87_00975 [Renibacterium salmoninarum]|nr:hypothetical protein [Renibacterium salmoninarum]
MKRLIPLILLIPLLAACGGASASKPSDCLTVPDELVSQISERGKPQPLSVIASAAMKSSERTDVYFISLRFNPRGSDEPLTGIWAVPNLEKNQTGILPVNGFAKEFTSGPDWSKANIKFSSAERSASDSMKCLPE